MRRGSPERPPAAEGPLAAEGPPATAEGDVPVSPFLSVKLRMVTWLAVLAVVWVHAYNLGSRALVGEVATATPGRPGVVGFVEYLGSQTLTRWPVAMFSAISGFLFFRDLAPVLARFVAKWRRRARTIVLPYLLWSAWSLLLFVVLHLVPGSDAYVSPGALHRLDLETLFQRLLVQPVAYPLWFLQALVTCVLLAPVIAWLVRRLEWAALAPFAAPWLLDVDVGPGDYVEFRALLFFTLGALVATRLRRRKWVPASGASGPARSAALGRWLFPLFVLASVAYTAVLRDDTGWHAGLLRKLLMCLAVAAVWFGYDAYLSGLAARRWAAAGAAFAFFVFAAHEPPLMTLERLFLRAVGGPGASDAAVLAVYVAAPVLAIALCLAAGLTLRRWVGPVYALLTGGRGTVAGGQPHGAARFSRRSPGHVTAGDSRSRRDTVVGAGRRG